MKSLTNNNIIMCRHNSKAFDCVHSINALVLIKVVIAEFHKVIFAYVTFLGDHNWLQSDAAFVYPRLDKYSLSVGMFWSTCCLSRSPLGRLATASSLAGNVS